MAASKPAAQVISRPRTLSKEGNWKEIEPPQSERRPEILRPVGADDGVFVVVVANDIAVWSSARGWKMLEPPQPVVGSSVCLSEGKVVGILAQGAADRDPAPPGESPRRGRSVAWSLDIDSGSARTTPLPFDSTASEPLAYATACADDGILLLASDGSEVVDYQAARGTGKLVGRTPTPVTPKPLAVSTPEGSFLVASPAIGVQHHIAYDSATEAWRQVDIPEFLDGGLPEELSSGPGLTALLYRNEQGVQRLAVRGERSK